MELGRRRCRRLHDCWWGVGVRKVADFEKPTDRMGTEPSTAVATDNIYEIMVEATDGTGHVGREAVEVEVTNVDEDGTVKLSALQPASSVPFTATLTDIDGPTGLTNSAEWQWSRSTRTSGGWTDIDKETSSSYIPDVDGTDSGYYLRAMATYRDKQSPSGADNDKTASMVSANKVLALRTSNKALSSPRLWLMKALTRERWRRPRRRVSSWGIRSQPRTKTPMTY